MENQNDYKIVKSKEGKMGSNTYETDVEVLYSGNDINLSFCFILL